MVDYNASEHKQSQQEINNPQLFKNVPSKKRMHSSTYFDNILLTITNNKKL
jgi:hypothetical protein